MKTTTVDLARLARTFKERAQPVAGVTTSNRLSETEVDVRIGVDLHEAARAVAEFNDQHLNDVARAILFTAASKITQAQVNRYRKSQAEKIAMAMERATARARKRGLSEDEVKLAAQRAGNKILRQRLPLRGYRQERYRLRFTVPTEEYNLARDAIQSTGVSVAVAVEDGLKRYALTEGTID